MSTDSSSEKTYSDPTDSHGTSDSSSSYTTPSSSYTTPSSSSPPPTEDSAVKPEAKAKAVRVVDPNARVTDRPVGALALVALRIAVALIMAAHGIQKLRDMTGTKAFFDSAGVPSPEVMAQVTAWGEIAIAVALVIGIAVRLAGLGTIAVAVGALVFIKLKDGLFPDGVEGFAGEYELLLVASGLVLLLLGGGAWGADKFFRGFNKRGMAAIKS